MNKKILVLALASMLFLTSITVVDASNKTKKIKSEDFETLSTYFDEDVDFKIDCKYEEEKYVPGEIIVKFRKQIMFLARAH